jgi:hypothetical protein
MDHNFGHNSYFGAITSLTSLGSASFSLLTIEQVQPIITLVGSLIATGSGIMAIRYYITATNKLKRK